MICQSYVRKICGGGFQIIFPQKFAAQMKTDKKKNVVDLFKDKSTTFFFRNYPNISLIIRY